MTTLSEPCVSFFVVRVGLQNSHDPNTVQQYRFLGFNFVEKHRGPPQPQVFVFPASPSYAWYLYFCSHHKRPVSCPSLLRNLPRIRQRAAAEAAAKQEVVSKQVGHARAVYNSSCRGGTLSCLENRYQICLNRLRCEEWWTRSVWMTGCPHFCIIFLNNIYNGTVGKKITDQMVHSCLILIL